MNLHSRQHPAFTVVELLIVISLIGILAAIITATLGGIRMKALEAALQSDLNNASKQLAIERATSGAFPDNADGIRKTNTTVYQYRTDGATYCLTATAQGASKAFRTDDSSNVTEGLCSGHFADVYATGGQVVEVEDGGATYRIHNFTASGKFTLLKERHIEYLVVAGGGGGGGSRNSIRGSGGGGAGGVVTGDTSLPAGAYSITIGKGGDGGTETSGSDGEDSTFHSVQAYGGGGGSWADNNYDDTGHDGNPGGSGGGAGGQFGSGGAGVSGQGFAGGSAPGINLGRGGGGGGGAGGAGADGHSNLGGDGGPGMYVWGRWYAGGGGGGAGGGGVGGSGIGGQGSGSPGLAQTGSGGGGTIGVGTTGGDGSSGIVIIRYRTN